MSTYMDRTSAVAQIQSLLKGNLTNSRLQLQQEPYPETRIVSSIEELVITSSYQNNIYTFDVRATGNRYIDLTTLKFYAVDCRASYVDGSNLPIKASVINNLSQTCWKRISIKVGLNEHEIELCGVDIDKYALIQTLLAKSSVYVNKNSEDIIFAKDTNSPETDTVMAEDARGYANFAGTGFSNAGLESRSSIVNNINPFTMCDFIPSGFFKQDKLWPPGYPLRIEFTLKPANEIIIPMLPNRKSGATAPATGVSPRFSIGQMYMVYTSVEPSDVSLAETVFSAESIFNAGMRMNSTLEYARQSNALLPSPAQIALGASASNVKALYPFDHSRVFQQSIPPGTVTYTYALNGSKLRTKYIRMVLIPSTQGVGAGIENNNPLYFQRAVDQFAVSIDGVPIVAEPLRRHAIYQFDKLEQTQKGTYARENLSDTNVLTSRDFIQGGMTVYGIYTGYSGNPSSFEIATNANIYLTITFPAPTSGTINIYYIQSYTQMVMMNEGGLCDSSVSL